MKVHFPKFIKDRPKIGLALGSGGAKGVVHIGVIKSLEKHNIPIDYIAGTSIGALLGGFYAAGISLKELEELALGADRKLVFSVLFDNPHFKQGLIDGKKTEAFIEKYIGKKKISDCKIPFAAIATNLKTGDIAILNRGELVKAIRASISVPMAYKPYELDGNLYLDGGLSAPVPVEVARNMGADIVIAVNLDKFYPKENIGINLLGLANDSLDIMRHHLSELNSKSADIVLNIDAGNSLWFQFENGQDKITKGEEAMTNKLPELLKLISAKEKPSRFRELLFKRFK